MAPYSVNDIPRTFSALCEALPALIARLAGGAAQEGRYLERLPGPTFAVPRLFALPKAPCPANRRTRTPDPIRFRAGLPHSRIRTSESMPSAALMYERT